METLAILFGVLALGAGCILAAFLKGKKSGKQGQALTDQTATVKASEEGQKVAQEQAQAAVNMPTPEATQELMRNDPQNF